MSQEVIRGIALPPAAQPGDPLARVDTPSLALDLAAFEANLRAMQAWADRHGVALRPHAKAHKCPQVALRQLALGARGICCQKVSEALPFVAAGVRDIHISNEVVGPAKLALLAQLARAARISVCVDNAANLAQISRAMAGAGVEVDVLVEIDVGQGRCGASDEATVLALAQQARDLPGVNFAGLQAYHGSVQHARGARNAPASVATPRASPRPMPSCCAKAASPATPSPAAAPAASSSMPPAASTPSCRPVPTPSWTATTAPTNGADR